MHVEALRIDKGSRRVCLLESILVQQLADGFWMVQHVSFVVVNSHVHPEELSDDDEVIDRQTAKLGENRWTAAVQVLVASRSSTYTPTTTDWRH